MSVKRIPYVSAGHISVRGRTGANALLFNGAFPPGTALAPGTYAYRDSD